jgi:hypothetical protein
MLVDSRGSMKPARQSEGDTILVPHLATPAGLEFQHSRHGQWLAVDGIQELFLRRFVGEELAAEHQAVAHAML